MESARSENALLKSRNARFFTLSPVFLSHWHVSNSFWDSVYRKIGWDRQTYCSRLVAGADLRVIISMSCCAPDRYRNDSRRCPVGIATRPADVTPSIDGQATGFSMLSGSKLSHKYTKHNKNMETPSGSAAQPQVLNTSSQWRQAYAGGYAECLIWNSIWIN